VLASDDNAVTDVVIDAEGEAVVLDTGGESSWLALMDVLYTETTASEWSVTGSVDDCQADVALTVTVTNTWGLQATEVVWWPELEAAPSGVQPPHGPDSGGTEITIYGDDLSRTSEVWFAQKEATVVEASDDQVIVLSPSGEAGPRRGAAKTQSPVYGCHSTCDISTSGSACSVTLMP
jgi:hypothetical protein